MKEEFLHYLWKYQLYNKNDLCDAAGNKITVINQGEYNRDSGPDFFNARILVDDLVWAGNIEIHIKSSHFENHGHYKDPAYDNVILHVVLENDRKVYNNKGQELLTVEITFDPTLYDKYIDLINNSYSIACHDKIRALDKVFITSWLNFIMVERLQNKAEYVLSILKVTSNDWDEVFYRLLSRYFGLRVNAEPFEMLSKTLPLKIIRKHSDSIFQIESLLFGAAGMLADKLFKDAINDEYFNALKKEYMILAAKYSISSMHGLIWKFARMRPYNFPTVRIAQLAKILSVTGGLFSRVLDVSDIKQLSGIFEVSASDYWKEHFVFGKSSGNVSKKTGADAVDIILINAVLPVMFVYGQYTGNNDICEKVLDFMEKIKVERNTIIREWEKIGVKVSSAFGSQALIQLKNCYCNKRRCLECRIGNRLIINGIELKSQEDMVLES